MPLSGARGARLTTSRIAIGQPSGWLFLSMGRRAARMRQPIARRFEASQHVVTGSGIR